MQELLSNPAVEHDRELLLLEVSMYVTCPPKTGPGSELVLLENLRPIGGQDEAESFYR